MRKHWSRLLKSPGSVLQAARFNRRMAVVILPVVIVTGFSLSYLQMHHAKVCAPVAKTTAAATAPPTSTLLSDPMASSQQPLNVIALPPAPSPIQKTVQTTTTPVTTDPQQPTTDPTLSATKTTGPGQAHTDQLRAITPNLHLSLSF